MTEAPVLLLPCTFSADDVQTLRNKAIDTVDLYADQLKELYRIKFPDKQGDEDNLDSFIKRQPQGELAGAWVYYPWSKKLLHTVAEKHLLELRTNRNKNLITEAEQQQLTDATIGVAGMSVGAGIAISAVYSGMSKHIKIADFDSIDTSNLNRLRENLLAVGQKKVAVASRHIYEIDPFVTVHQFSEGLTDENLAEFFESPNLQIVIDEIDDFKMKIKLRLAAKDRRVPLLMFTSLGDNILVDVERYDTEPDTEPFHGLLGDLPLKLLEKDEITPEDVRQLSVKLVGEEYVPTRALQSVTEMGNSLVGRPQLYSTIAVDGGLAAYLSRQIILDRPVKTGRYFIKFAELFELNSDEFLENKERKSLLERLFGQENDTQT